jgi:hypothetical protein
VIAVRIFLKKRSENVSQRDAKLIIFAVVILVIGYTVSPVIDLYSSFEDADYYFFVLSK